MIRSFLIAVTFLTRLPFPAPDGVTQEEFTKSQRYYPLIGFLIGLFLFFTALILRRYYSPLVVAALILIEELLLTGGLHMDGFMDSMDALWSARTPERMLEIMKDSRVGSFGALSAMAVLLLKFSLLAELLQTAPSFYPFLNSADLYSPFYSGIRSYLPLLIMPMLARWAFLIGVIFFPYARNSGLGQGFHEDLCRRPWDFIIVGVCCLLFAVYLLHWAGLGAFLFTFLLLFYFMKKVANLLGGLTGDLYGAGIELSELLFLLAVTAFI